jgi:septum formation protein
MYRLSRPLFLASQSPRRKSILTQFGFDYAIKASEVPENSPYREPRKRAMHLAEIKSLAAGSKIDKGIILGFDTLVYFRGKVLEKPKNAVQAKAMLSMLSGSTHTVYTGMAMLLKPENRIKVSCEETKVTFRKLDAKEIKNYISTGEPFDKAGAYGIQGMGGSFVSKVGGCFFNVVGLPAAPLMRNLKPFILS